MTETIKTVAIIIVFLLSTAILMTGKKSRNMMLSIRLLFGMVVILGILAIN